MVSILLDHGAATNCANKNWYQLLRYASYWRERPGIIDLLVNKGVNLNGITEVGRTPLHVACEHDHVLNVRILFALYARAGLKLPGDLLYTTVSRARPSIIEALLKHGLDPNCREFFCGKTALHQALEEFAIAKVPGKNERTDERQEAWKLIVQTLLKYKAHVGAADTFSDQPLHSLVRRRKPEADIDDHYKGMIDLLLTSGADRKCSQ